MTKKNLVIIEESRLPQIDSLDNYSMSNLKGGGLPCPSNINCNIDCLAVGGGCSGNGHCSGLATCLVFYPDPVEPIE